jgi:hypothetical protein
MKWKLAGACLAILLCAFAASAWETDANIVSGEDYPSYVSSNGFIAVSQLGSALDNEAGTLKAAAYWATNSAGCHVVYSQKDASSGVWNREILATIPNDATNGCMPGFMKLALAPTGEIVIAYSYARADLSNNTPTAGDLHIVLKYKNSSGWQGTTELLNYTYPNPALLTTAHAFFPPDGAMICGPDGAIDVYYTYLSWVGGVETLSTKAFHGSGPASGTFGSGETNTMMTSQYGTTEFSPAAPVMHVALPSVAGPRCFLDRSTQQDEIKVTNIDYYANVTSETDAELFPVLDTLEETTGLEIDSPVLDKIEDIVRVVCDVPAESETALVKVGAIADSVGMPIFAGIDNTGACTVAYLEPVSLTIHLAAEMESVSSLWVKSPVVGPNGGALGYEQDSSGNMTSLSFPIGLTSGSSLKLLILKYAAGTDDDHPSMMIRMGTKTGAYAWTWTPELYATSTTAQQMCPHMSPFGSFVIHTASNGAIVASTP